MKTVTLADLEACVDRSSIRENEGEAAIYGIAYDDSSYDYMSHLKPIGTGAEEVILIPGPKGSAVATGMKIDRKGKAKATDLFDLPGGVFASEQEMSLDEVYSKAEGVPTQLQGLQPDMDPHLRQVLEALDDDAFVDQEGDEGWFEELVAGGEGEGEEWEFREDGEDGEGAIEQDEEKEERDETWEDRFKAFKAAQADGGEVAFAERSVMGDTIGSHASSLSDMMVVGGKKRRGKRGPSDASGMSMSSSSMFRNQGLRTLDERFDKVGPRSTTRLTAGRTGL